MIWKIWVQGQGLCFFYNKDNSSAYCVSKELNISNQQRLWDIVVPVKSPQICVISLSLSLSLSCSLSHTRMHSNTKAKISISIEPSLKGLQFRNYCMYVFLLCTEVRQGAAAVSLALKNPRAAQSHIMHYANIHLILCDVESCWSETLAWRLMCQKCECVFFFT